ncbi:tetratricopeptide repeat protein [Labilibacter marinus]|uniref:tetratricopeptide repeat protein n=1 Tax=Labilibacter marinus TaxID=1477105 RepID=UPI00083098F8|nr:tetratricopeptide repeat protein [Labilibacter marinus]
MIKLVIRLFLHIALLINSSSLWAIELDSVNIEESLSRISEVYSESSDSSINEFLKSIAYYKEQQDTLKMIDINLKLVTVYTGNGRYSDAYDQIWHLLTLVEAPKFAEQKFGILNKLIGLYLLYEQHEKAIECYQQLPGLVQTASLTDEKKVKYQGRIFGLGAWIELKTTKDLKRAERLCLMSIEQYKKIKNKPGFLHHSQTQLAHIYILMQKAEKAYAILKQLESYYTGPLKREHALLGYRLAQYYQLVDDEKNAISYYKISLAAIDTFKTLLDKKPESYKKLASIYYNQGDFKQAFDYQQKAVELNNRFFSASQSQNKQLFEIKNKYQEEVLAQEMQLIKTKNQILQLKTYLIVLGFIIMIIVLVFLFKRKARKDILSHKLQNQKHLLEIEKQSEILELKNKELLSSALQLLEQDNWQADIKKRIAKLKLEGANAEIIQDVKSSLQVDTSNKWKEFEARFAAVNDSFFVKLKELYPRLTPTDLKMCAFIKLGFSSKDMSQIMGITVEGINTSRSRLRKKMDLQREVILSEYLQAYK